jgi:hypothetical protein
MPWKKLLATGQIDEALRQKLEFVLEENRVYRALYCVNIRMPLKSLHFGVSYTQATLCPVTLTE